MLFRHPGHPQRAVRLGYCLNVHPAETLAGVIEGMREITLPLRERLACTSTFGVGMYLPAVVAAELASESGRAKLLELAAFLADHDLDPFTYNAFPYGRFHSEGLKEAVFEPAWTEPERRQFTLDVAQVAALLLRERQPSRHVSISTHTGMHVSKFIGPWLRPVVPGKEAALCLVQFQKTSIALRNLERNRGLRIVLALEPEPRSSCNDLRELAEWRSQVESVDPVIIVGSSMGEERTVFGTCLDTCHAAVEFETPERALGYAIEGGGPLGKIQFTSALAVKDPVGNTRARERFFALDEPRFLHQVTGRGPFGLVRAGDIPDARAAWEAHDPAWLDTQEWRCHFHVPVDLPGMGIEGLETTRDYSGDVLAQALAHPELWGTAELHVEIETYTWSVLPREARGTGELVDGLEREYRHVIGLLRAAGWMSA